MFKIGVVILQYNKAETTLRCLESVLKSDYADFFVVVVDNKSEDHEIEKLKNYKNGNFKLILNGENLGYAGGNNIGTNYAFDNGADYVLVLNNDTEINHELISDLAKNADKNTILSAPIKEGNKVIYGGQYEWFRFEGSHLNQRQDIDPPNTYLIGACLFFPKEIWQKTGPIDERYFLYFEDLDFSMKARKFDFKLKVLDITPITHITSTSTVALGKPRLFYLHYRNALLFQWQFAPIYIKIMLPAYILLLFGYLLVRVATFRDYKITKAMYLGIIDFISARYGNTRKI